MQDSTQHSSNVFDLFQGEQQSKKDTKTDVASSRISEAFVVSFFVQVYFNNF
jgi:hypothetical protein